MDSRVGSLAYDDFMRVVDDLPSWQWSPTWQWGVLRGRYPHVPGQVAARARAPLGDSPLGRSILSLLEKEDGVGEDGDDGALAALGTADGPDAATLALPPNSGHWATVVVGFDPSYAVPALYLRCSDQGAAQRRQWGRGCPGPFAGR